MFKPKKAFTLIELLVVIAIIGILATVSVIALSNARAKSRDAKRIGDVKQIQTALELYFNDMSRYPLTAEFADAISSTSTQGTTTYMARIPVAATPADGDCSDPDNSFYYSSADGSTYTLSFCIGGNTGSLTAGLNTLSPGGIAYGGPGSGGGSGPSCSCTSASIPCCDQCNPATAVCQGGTYCANNSNCPVGQGCNNGTCADFFCGANLIDARDGQSYPTISVGGECWMAKNMNIGTMIAGGGAQSDNPLIEKYCYNDVEGNCTALGGLYQWDEATQYDSAGLWNDEQTQGVCPVGWHIPSITEWDALINTFGGNSLAGFELKASATSTPPWDGYNTSGFTALKAGDREPSGAYAQYGSYTFFWTTYSYTGSESIVRAPMNGSDVVNYWGYSHVYGMSVRCIMD